MGKFTNYQTVKARFSGAAFPVPGLSDGPNRYWFTPIDGGPRFSAIDPMFHFIDEMDSDDIFEISTCEIYGKVRIYDARRITP